MTILGGGLLLFMIWWFLDLAIDMSHFIEAIGIFVMLTVAGFGLSLFMGVYGTLFPLLYKVISALSRGLMFVSAVMHPAVGAATRGSVRPRLQSAGARHGNAALLHHRHRALSRPLSFAYFGMFTASCLFMGFISYYANRHKVLEQ